MNKYPGVFFIDAHQTSSGYFFPPNEDPVHHEICHFALDFIQNGIGPALQDAFNDQSIAVPQLQLSTTSSRPSTATRSRP